MLVKRIRTQELSDSSVVLQLTRNPAKKLGLVLHAKEEVGVEPGNLEISLRLQKKIF